MKEKVLVIFGSMSSEHEISCISAGNVIENLDKDKYEIAKLGIDKAGDWYYYNGEAEAIKNNYWTKDIMNKVLVKDLMGELKKYDVIFPVLHGKYGEDGAINGLLEMAGVNYVGCKMLGSSISMDKVLSKELVKLVGIDIVPYIYLSSRDFYNEKFDKQKLYSEILEKLKLPVIVKPSKEGSSYGVTKVDTLEEIVQAIDFAFKYDDEVLIETYIVDRKEIECAVLEDTIEGRLYVSTPGEVISANEFYDYNAKYENDKSYIEIPAKISEEQIERIKECSEKAFRILRSNSLSRMDFFTSGEKVYFNEANTMPGFTDISMYPMMLIHDGISYSQILDILIKNAKV